MKYSLNNKIKLFNFLDNFFPSQAKQNIMEYADIEETFLNNKMFKKRKKQ